jgi:hypothetical protein
VTTGRPRRTLQPEELAAVVRWIARTWLEIERGHRNPLELRRYLAPHLAFGLEHAIRPTGVPAVTRSDIRGVQVERIGRRTAYGVVAIREADGTGSALMFELRRDTTGSWKVTEVLRPHQRAPQPRRESPAGRIR